MNPVYKELRWVGSSRKDLASFPKAVKRHVGQALYAAQFGEEYPSVKALKGFGGRPVLEVVALHDGDTYRAVYTVRFRGVLYVLHAFEEFGSFAPETLRSLRNGLIPIRSLTRGTSPRDCAHLGFRRNLKEVLPRRKKR